jgi:tetratricopeptide (TPR) repeat protein
MYMFITPCVCVCTRRAQAVRDFQDALALEPGNAELSKLLQTARDKYLEVEGVSVEEAAAGGRASAAAGGAGGGARTEVAVQMLEVEAVGSVTALLMPTAGSFEFVGSGELRLLATPAPTSGFVRISVVSDDEGESDAEGAAAEEEASAASGNAGGAYSRVAIVEDSESDEDEEEAAEPEATPAQKAAAAAAAEELKDRGNALLQSNKAREAVQAYTDSLAIDPKFVAALNNRAQAHLVLKVR